MPAAYRPLFAIRISIVAVAMLATVISTPAMAAEWTTVEIDNGVKTTLRVEIAATRAERIKGLSGRTDPLAAGTGMLFVFNPPQDVCMWMKDTHIPLAAAFIRGDGRVVKAASMQPHTTHTHCADTEVLYVLEANPRLLNDTLTVGATVHVNTPK